MDQILTLIAHLLSGTMGLIGVLDPTIHVSVVHIPVFQMLYPHSINFNL